MSSLQASAVSQGPKNAPSPTNVRCEFIIWSLRLPEVTNHCHLFFWLENNNFITGENVVNVTTIFPRLKTKENARQEKSSRALRRTNTALLLSPNHTLLHLWPRQLMCADCNENKPHVYMGLKFEKGSAKQFGIEWGGARSLWLRTEFWPVRRRAFGCFNKHSQTRRWPVLAVSVYL